jgi:hypothetical protein
MGNPSSDFKHFHFYAAQSSPAMCGFSSTPASKLAGDPVFLRKSRVGASCSVCLRNENAELALLRIV